MATKKTPTRNAAAKRPTGAKTPAAKAAAPKTAAPKTAAPRVPAKKAAAPKPQAARAAKPAADLTAPLFAAGRVEDIVPLTEEAMKPVEAAVAASQETLEAVVKAGTQAATKGYEQAVAITQEHVEKASSSVFNGYGEVADLSRGNMDAYVASTEVVARGFETLGKEFIAFTQASMETGMAAAKSLATAKSFEEVIELQSAYSRSSFDSMLAESAKLTDLSIALANDAMEPLQNSVTATVEKMIKPLAA